MEENVLVRDAFTQIDIPDCFKYTKVFKSAYFAGAGEHSVEMSKKAHEILDEALVIISGMQQMGIQGYESEQNYLNNVQMNKLGEAKLRAIAEDLVMAILGNGWEIVPRPKES